MTTISDLLVRWQDAHRVKWSKVHVRRTEGARSTCCGRWIPQGRREQNGKDVSGAYCVRCFEFVYGGKR